jgi:hypothetical protein
MNKQIFLNGLSEIQAVFNSEYNDAMKSVIWKICSKWRENTFNLVITNFKETFKPSYNYHLPFPADFKSSLSEIHVEEEKTWKHEKRPDNAADLEGWLVYKKTVSDLVKKISGSDKFRLRTSHIDGVFACEICFREGCPGKEIADLREGCAGFLSEERANEIKKNAEIVKV